MRNIIFLTAFFSIFFSSCKKERILYKGDGVWDISKVDYVLIDQNVDTTINQSVKTGTATNAGKFTFEEEGKGSYQYTIEGTSYSKAFNWTYANDEVSIISTGMSLDLSGLFSGNVNMNQKILSITGKAGSSTMTLTGTEASQSINTANLSIGQNASSLTFVLKR